MGGQKSHYRGAGGGPLPKIEDWCDYVVLLFGRPNTFNKTLPINDDVNMCKSLQI